MRYLLLLLMISASFRPPGSAAGAGRAYWLWAGVSRIPDDASSVYLHQGHWQESEKKNPHLIALGMSPHELDARNVHLVWRLTTINGPDQLVDLITTRIRRWEAFKVEVSGIQLDFDAATYGLTKYQQFLRRIRERLPGAYQLSVTGLADWAPNAKVGDLEQLGQFVNHIDFQFYQGTRPVQDWTGYLRGLRNLKVPYRVGLLESMEIPADLEQELSRSRFYLGKIYFRSLKTTSTKEE
jgi:hypothetical protein